MEISVVNRYGGREVGTRDFTSLLRWLARRLERTGSGCTVLLCGNREIEALNHRFLGRSRPTDVLAFPSGNDGDEQGYLGDIAVSVETARLQATRNGLSLGEEINRLIVHGFLHLLGFDHETDNGEMRRIEKTLLRERTTTGYRIRRVAGSQPRKEA